MIGNRYSEVFSGLRILTIWRLPNVGIGMNPGSMSYIQVDFYSLFSENGIKGKGTMSLMTHFFGLCPNPTWNVLRYIGNISRRISWKVISQRTIGGKLAIERSSMYGQKPRKQKTLHLRLTGKVQRSFAIGLIMTT